MQSGYNGQPHHNRPTGNRPNLPVPSGQPGRIQPRGSYPPQQYGVNNQNRPSSINHTSRPQNNAPNPPNRNNYSAVPSGTSPKMQSRPASSQVKGHEPQSRSIGNASQLNADRSRVKQPQSGRPPQNSRPTTNNRPPQNNCSNPNRQARPANLPRITQYKRPRKNYVLHDFLLGLGIGLAVFGTAAIFVVNSILNLIA